MMTGIFNSKRDREEIVERVAAAVNSGDFELVEKAIRRGWIDPNMEMSNGRALLAMVARKCPLHTVELLVAKGAKIDSVSLITAVVAGRANVVRFFLEKGADTTERMGTGFDALDYANFYEHKEIAEMIKADRARHIATLQRNAK